MANKYSVEMQIGYAELAKKEGKASYKNGQDAYYNVADYEVDANGGSERRTYRRPSEQEIAEVREWIKEQRKKYPGDLETLFCRWESLMGNAEKANAAEKAKITADAAQKESDLQKTVGIGFDKALQGVKRYARFEIRTYASNGNGTYEDPIPQGVAVTLTGKKTKPGEETLVEICEVSMKAGSVKRSTWVKLSELLIEAPKVEEGKAGSTQAPAPEAQKPGNGTVEAQKPAPQETKKAFAVLRDGSPVYGMYLHHGQVWIIGKAGERKPVESSNLPPEMAAKYEALSENGKILTPMVDDAATLIQAIANHAVIENWKPVEDFQRNAAAFIPFIESLDASDVDKAKKEISKFVRTRMVDPKSAVGQEIAEVFSSKDSDADRRKKVYAYIRGEIGLRSKTAGFAGGSEMLANKIAKQELAKKDVSPEKVKAFIAELVDTGLRSKSPEEVAKHVASKRGEAGIYSFLFENLGEKGIVAFVKDFRKANEELKAAYNSKDAEKAYAGAKKKDGSLYTEKEIAELKDDSRKAKLAEFVSGVALVAYAKKHADERKTNFDLDTFASIQGAGFGEMSDRTRLYIRNDLWKDVAIEVAALGVGAVTAGLGAAGVHALAALRWGKRVEGAYEATRGVNLGIRTAANVVGGGVGFEAGHGAVRTTVASVKAGEFQNQYSWESLVQSMVFAGAFHVAGEILAARGIRFDPTKPMSEQKLILAKHIGADSLASLGVSYGISWKQGEDYTLEEALQAIAMAAMFRAAMTRASGIKFRAARDVRTGEVTVTPEAAPASAAVPEVAPVREGVVEPRERAEASGRERVVKASEWEFSPEDIQANSRLSLSERIKAAEEVLQKKLTPEQEKALLDAHYTGARREDGKFGYRDTAKKLEILEKAGFTKEERKLLLRSGLSGSPQAFLMELAAADKRLQRKAGDAFESVAGDSRKLKEVYSDTWIRAIAQKLGKSAAWVGDKSVGPLFRLTTGNNPSELMALTIPGSGYGTKLSTAWTKFANHWKHPFSNAGKLLVTGEMHKSKTFTEDVGNVLKNVSIGVAGAAGITAMDYFMDGDEEALEPEKIAQKYYEVILLGWLGITLANLGGVKETASSTLGFVSDRLKGKPLTEEDA